MQPNMKMKLENIKTLVTLDCEGQRHKIVLWENGQVTAIHHPPEEALFELGRDLAEQGPANQCMAALRALRGLGSRGDLPPELSGHISDAKELRRARERDRQRQDPLTVALRTRLFNRMASLASDFETQWTDAYIAWAQTQIPGSDYTIEAEITRIRVDRRALLNSKTTREQRMGCRKKLISTWCHAEPSAFLLWNKGIGVVRPFRFALGGPSPALILSARRVSPETYRCKVVCGRGPKRIKPQLWEANVTLGQYPHMIRRVPRATNVE